MTATILQMRDYKTPEERQLEIERFDHVVSEDTSPCEMGPRIYGGLDYAAAVTEKTIYSSDDSGDCA